MVAQMTHLTGVRSYAELLACLELAPDARKLHQRSENESAGRQRHDQPGPKYVRIWAVARPDTQRWASVGLMCVSPLKRLS